MGIMFPGIETVEQAKKFVSYMRYNRPKTDKLYEPAGMRGSGGGVASWFWVSPAARNPVVDTPSTRTSGRSIPQAT